MNGARCQWSPCIEARAQDVTLELGSSRVRRPSRSDTQRRGSRTAILEIRCGMPDPPVLFCAILLGWWKSRESALRNAESCASNVEHGVTSAVPEIANLAGPGCFRLRAAPKVRAGAERGA